MKYHDYHLKSYAVYDGGTRIVLTLSWRYPGPPREESVIDFSDVALYRFIHTAGAIISEIRELPLESSIEREAQFLADSERLNGVRYWRTDLSTYTEHLKAQGFRYYDITSAVGFTGFVIAKHAR